MPENMSKPSVLPCTSFSICS